MIKVFDLGLISFKEGLDFQNKIFNQVKSGALSHAFILCQHKPVITLGRQASRNNIFIPEAELENKGIELYETNRGGDVTYHGPGQLMLYPIINLTLTKRDIRLFLRNLEETAIELFADLGLYTKRISGLTGVWLGDKKIASIGISVKNWITYHGIALNIKKYDLDNFSLIRPCGMDIMMASLEASLGKELDINETKKTLTRRLQNGENYLTSAWRGDRKSDSLILVH